MPFKESIHKICLIAPSSDSARTVQALHAALTLRGWATQLESKPAAVGLMPEHVNRHAADVLHAVAEALGQVKVYPCT